MSQFTHAICPSCWEFQYGMQKPVKLTDPRLEQCCFCQQFTIDPTYVRHDPLTLPCRGELGYHLSEA